MSSSLYVLSIWGVKSLFHLDSDSDSSSTEVVKEMHPILFFYLYSFGIGGEWLEV